MIVSVSHTHWKTLGQRSAILFTVDWLQALHQCCAICPLPSPPQESTHCGPEVSWEEASPGPFCGHKGSILSWLCYKEFLGWLKEAGYSGPGAGALLRLGSILELCAPRQCEPAGRGAHLIPLQMAELSDQGHRQWLQVSGCSKGSLAGPSCPVWVCQCLGLLLLHTEPYLGSCGAIPP